MTSPPGNFASQSHLTLASTSIYPSQSSGQVSRNSVMNLERLGLPDGLHGPSQQGSSSSAPQQGKMKGHPHGKKTKGRVKIKMEFIDNKLRRYTTFSKRKAGLMKKAYELSTLTGTEVMLLVASETGHVYTFATRKLQPMIASEDGKKLIQTCLNSNLPNGCEPGGLEEPMEHRMSLGGGGGAGTGGTGYDDEDAGDDDEEDEYFDEDGDSSNAGGASPPPLNTPAGATGRFHGSAAVGPLHGDSLGQYTHADYSGGAGGAGGDAYYYDPEGKNQNGCRNGGNGQDDAGLLNQYEVENLSGNFGGPAGMSDSSRR